MSDRVVTELDAVKRLLILLLLKIGSTSEEIGAALGVHHSRVRQLVPSGKVKKIVFSGPKE